MVRGGQEPDVKDRLQHHTRAALSAASTFANLAMSLLFDLIMDDRTALASSSPATLLLMTEAAARFGYDKVLGLLLTQPRRPLKEDLGRALYFAAECDHADAVRKLLIYGVNPNFVLSQEVYAPIIGTPVRRAEFDYVQGTSPSPPHTNTRHILSVPYRNVQGASPVFIAVQNNNIEVVRELVKVKADINQATCDGDTPVHIAAQFGRMEILKLLIAAEGNLSCKNKLGLSPANAALRANELGARKLLLDLGAV